MDVKSPSGIVTARAVPNFEYALPASDFHRVRPITDEVLTIVVVGEKGLNDPQYCKPRLGLMTPDEVKELMEHFAAWM
jgi:hypothetical protein